MTKSAWNRTAFVMLAMGACAIAACSDTDKPPTGGGTSGAVPIVPAGGDGGDSGKPGDGGSDASANNCNTIPNKAPSYSITFSTAPEPPPFVGGTIENGTYFRTSEVRYGEASGMAPITAPGITLTLAAPSMLYGAYTADNEYVPMAAQLTMPAVADAGDPDAGDADVEAGTGDKVVITTSCPIAGSSLGPQSYSVVGKDFTIGFGTYTVTYTKQ